MNRPIFTIGQVWPEFVKRLPRQLPRYRGMFNDLSLSQLAAMQQQQASPELLAQLAAMRAQTSFQNPSIPYLGGFGGLGGMFGHL